MKYLKRFLLGLGFLVGLNLLVVIVIWIQALIAVHQAREANADPAMPIEHHPVMTFPDFKHRSGGAGFWLDNDHLLIDGNVDGQVFGPTDLYVIDARDGSKTLFHKNAFLMYQNEDGSLHLALTDRDPNHIWHVDVVNDNFVAKEIDKPYPPSKQNTKYVFRSVGGNLFFDNDDLMFEKNGKIFNTGFKALGIPYGVEYSKSEDAVFIGISRMNSDKKTSGFYEISKTGSVIPLQYSSLIEKYKVKDFNIVPSRHGDIYFFIDNGGYSNNNGVFVEKNGELVKIWGRKNETRNIEDVELSSDGCRMSIGFKSQSIDPKKAGFEIMNICDQR